MQSALKKGIRTEGFIAKPPLWRMTVLLGVGLLLILERIYHETLHAVVRSERKSREEECDAFCAAEEAAAASTQRMPRYPVTRDGKTINEWVLELYPQCPSDQTYMPVGCTLRELMVRAGMPD